MKVDLVIAIFLKTCHSIFLGIGCGGIRTYADSFLVLGNGIRRPFDQTYFLSIRIGIRRHNDTSCFACSLL